MERGDGGGDAIKVGRGFWVAEEKRPRRGRARVRENGSLTG